MAETNVLRNHKDSVFRMLYRDKKELLQLYNALNETAYDNPDMLEVYTLENAIFMNVKNDVSFLLNSELNLYEHQASFNPNMPLRDLIYVTRQLERYLQKESLYSTKRIPVPIPRFVVFYNGTASQPERKFLKLSDAYEKKTPNPDLELQVLMLNINYGNNEALMQKCKTLRDYSLYVDRVRKHAKCMPVKAAILLAVDECIHENILSDFLRTQKAEVIAMSIFEYDEEEEMKKIRRDEYELGLEAGAAQATKKQQEENIRRLIQKTCAKLVRGKTAAQIADELEEDPAMISRFCAIAAAYAPEYDCDKIAAKFRASADREG